MTFGALDLPWKRIALYLAGGLAILFLIAPILILVPVSFSSAQYLTFPPPGLSLQWYADVFGQSKWMSAFWFSLQIAILTTVLSIVMALLAALALVRGRFAGKTLFYSLILLPMIVPVIATGTAIFFLFGRLHMLGNTMAFAIGHTVEALPIAVIIIVATLQGFDQRLEHAAISLGASPIQAFGRVTLPVIAPGVASAAVFAFLISFDELIVSLFLTGGPATETLPVRIWNDLISAIDPTVSAVSGLLLVIALILLVLLGLLQRHQG